MTALLVVAPDTLLIEVDRCRTRVLLAAATTFWFVSGCAHRRTVAPAPLGPSTVELVAQVNSKDGKPPIYKGLSFQGGASVLIFRVVGTLAGFHLRNPTAAELDFASGVRIPCWMPTQLDSRTLEIDVPFGYRTQQKVTCTVMWSSNGQLKQHSWTLDPLPAPRRFLKRTKPDARVHASHFEDRDGPGIDFIVLRPSARNETLELDVDKFTFDQGNFMANPERNNVFRIHYFFARDQDSAHVVVKRHFATESQGVINIASPSIGSERGKAFLEIPKEVSVSLWNREHISIPKQRARLISLREGKETRLAAMIHCDVTNAIQRFGSPEVSAKLAYHGPDLSAFGIESVFLPLQSLPKIRRDIRRYPLRMGPLPSFGFTYQAYLQQTEPVIDATVPIEAR